MLYITSNSGSICKPGTIAAGDSCDYDGFDRPIGGRIEFCDDSFELDEFGEPLEEMSKIMIETAIHEIAHVLGFTSKSFAFFFDHATGLPRTPILVSATDSLQCVQGNYDRDLYGELEVPDKSVLKFGAMYPGIRYYRIALIHNNCSSMKGIIYYPLECHIRDTLPSNFQPQILGLVCQYQEDVSRICH